MKKKSPAMQQEELLKDYLAANPQVLLELLDDELFPDGDREGVALRVERVDWDELSREIVSLPYGRNDPLLRYIQQQPEVLLRLLREDLGMNLPAYSTVTVEEQDLDHLVPQAPTHTVILCKARRKTVYGIAVDLMRTVVADKRRSWPLNAAMLHYRLESRTALVVVAAGPGVEDWAHTPIYWQGNDAPPFRPAVIGPSTFGQSWPAEAAQDPARTAFAALLGPIGAQS